MFLNMKNSLHLCCFSDDQELYYGLEDMVLQTGHHEGDEEMGEVHVFTR